MSNTVSVDKTLNATDWGIFAGLFVVLVGGMYVLGFSVNSLTTLMGLLTLTVLALLLWGMLTGHEKVAQFILDHQMVALAASVLVAASSTFAFASIAAVKSMHSN